MGVEPELHRVSNSDMIYLDHYLYQLRDFVYSKQVQETLFREKRQKASLRRFAPNQCRICGEIVPGEESVLSGLLPWDTTGSDSDDPNSLKHCHFCMDKQTCSACMATDPVYIPREVHLLQTPVKRRVCKPAYDLLRKYCTVKIDKQNPILQFKPELRRLLVLRRIVHKMFDMVKCDNWEGLIDKGIYKDYKFLVLRDCYLTFDLICEPAVLEE